MMALLNPTLDQIKEFWAGRSLETALYAAGWNAANRGSVGGF